MRIDVLTVERAEWESAQAEHLLAEKEYTRAGDALAASRRRLPATRVAAAYLTGPDGDVPLTAAFEGRSQLLAYTFMWHHGRPHHEQCEGCTFSISQVGDGLRAYLAERDVTFAVFCEGPWEEIAEYRDFMGWSMRWYSTADALDSPALAGGGFLRAFVRDGDDVNLTWETTGRGTEVLDPAYGLLDRTVFGRQEEWEDSPVGWPQTPASRWWRRDGRPVAQWLRTDGRPVAQWLRTDDPVPQTD